VGRHLLRAAVAVLGVLVLLVVVALVRVAPIDVRGLVRHDPGRSALMREREREAREAGTPYREVRHPVPLDRIARHLREAVLVAEDDKFFTHDGFDWSGIRDAARRDLRAHKMVRGGSTITQQLAKNLWLESSRTPWRKLEEMFLAIRLERTLTKRRILELYLNTIEWGEGVYGIDAAARHWFGVGAGSLDAGQSVRLAAVIINPRRFSPVEPEQRILHRIQVIAGRLRRRGAITEDEYRVALGLPPEAPAPAVDSTLFAPQDLPGAVPGAAPPADSTAPPAGEPEPAPTPEPVPADTSVAPR
jgi:monofunctional biosynthetic peptidoglycan transglycosylase